MQNVLEKELTHFFLQFQKWNTHCDGKSQNNSSKKWVKRIDRYLSRYVQKFGGMFLTHAVSG